jgi:starch synthase (maltosyl-transferring)
MALTVSKAKTITAAPARITVQAPEPVVDAGRYRVKRCVGDDLRFTVDIFRDGHEQLRAVVRYKLKGNSRWQESELHPIDAAQGGVRWAGTFAVDQPGIWRYDVEAWTDRFGTWRDELRRKVAAEQQDLTGELSEGVELLRATLAAASGESASLIANALERLEDPKLSQSLKCATALDGQLYDAVERVQPRTDATSLPAALEIVVERPRARFSAWYELFPRSWGGLRGVEEQLPRLAELGFDIIYLPPIHPIGLTNRKGRDNSLTAAPGDPGSPWSIGDPSGGHEAVHPELGTIEDVRSLTAAAREQGLEIALDFAIQCSADHPWLSEHPEWFHHRPDGSLKYAENPPKRYQDIYNVNWDSPDWRGLWNALLDVVLQWVEYGVTVFRVDNPHTKPAAFWAWLIERVHEQNPDVIFLAEAFTRRAVMRHLAKIGFTQSYTYFTWKNSRYDLTEYVTELASSGEQEYFRPNFFANTPDILHAYLQHGGRPAFEARLVLAATLSPSYGIYSGFEHCESVAVREGSEEYLHSEKYEIKQRALDGPLLGMVARLNETRRGHPALQQFDNITFLDTANDALIAYAKQTGADTVITVVNVDPRSAQEGRLIVPASLGLAPAFAVVDALDDQHYGWWTGGNYVRLEPGVRQAHVAVVQR